MALDTKPIPAMGNLMPTASTEQFYASKAGGQLAFNCTSGVVTTVRNEMVLLAFENPPTSGVNALISKFFLTTDTNSRFDRFRNGRISNGGTPLIAVNRGGGLNKPKCNSYAASLLTLTGGTLSKIQFISAFNELRDDIGGSIILQPGETIAWKFNTGSKLSGVNAAIEIVWWEVSNK